MTPLLLARALLEDSYDLATTDIRLEDHLADFIIDWGRLQIPDDAISEDGREDYIHVTVKYGLVAREMPPALQEITKGTKPFPIFLGSISLFTTSPDFDVVKIDVESPELRRLNKRISAAFQCKDTHPDYHPHVTVAYVKKGTCDHLDGVDPFEADGVPREFIAYGLAFRPPGDEDDPKRTEQMLLFSKTEKPDKALAMSEAVVGPSPDQMEAVDRIIKDAAAECNGDPKVFVVLANEQLEPYQVIFDSVMHARHTARAPGAPATATPGGVYLPVPSAHDLNNPQWFRQLSAMLHHELVHVGQMGRSKKPHEMYNKALDYVTPGGHLDQDRYLQQKQEIMAWAASMVESWRKQGLSKDEMMKRLRSGKWSFGMKYWHNRRKFPQAFNRFVKQAIEYIQALDESAVAETAFGPDPFAGIGFPADSGQTKFFLRKSSRRGDQPIL